VPPSGGGEALADTDGVLHGEAVIRSAGNGAAEIRNWLIAAEAVGGRGAEVIAYEPVASWVTGIALCEVKP